MVLRLSLAVVCVVPSVTASAQRLASEGGAPAAARLLLERGVHPALKWGRFSDFHGELRTLYPDSATPSVGYHWLVSGRPTSNALAVVRALQTIETRGLSPTDFDAAWLAAQADRLTRPGADDEEQRAQFDVGLSLAALRASWALHRGSVRVRDVHPTFRLLRPAFDVGAFVRQLARITAIDSALTSLEPDYLHYALTKAALARYRRRADTAATMVLPPPPGSRRTVTVGMSWAGASTLRRMLIESGDLAADSVAPSVTQYVPALVRAVQRFQRRHGLDADGDLGPETRAALARPLADRIRALELSLERWRWLPRLAEQRSAAPLVFVNIPAFRLYAFTGPTDDETNLLTMDVVVGKAVDNETPVFSDTLSSIVFAPYWDVPASIATKEIWPKAKADPSYLARNHYEVVRGRIRQKPGPWNSLGKVKFLFPNDYAVYMHDTPSQRAFRRSRRDESHGCVRLADPKGFARWLLPDTTMYSAKWLDEAFRRDTSLVVPVPSPRPVVLMYATAMTRQSGETEFYPDIYDYDAKLWARMRQGYPRAR
ncbi:MAG: L,D-transpeptidase family protein [Gemmatimonadaceae bacterium]|jgi:murein L,D-transpeptidase YcbB/YkuD|nr:L,D-transpeptidase family protein [Gemmatimonadaceae bacterium]